MTRANAKKVLAAAVIIVVAASVFVVLRTCEKHVKLSDVMSAPIAHRGVYDNVDVGENSLRAFELAIEKGYPIELDVLLSSDGKLMVIHDTTLIRFIGSDTQTRSLTSSEISSMQILKTQDTVPYFADVLELIDDKIPLLIEVKSYGDDENKLLSSLEDALSTYEGEYAVQSFNWRFSQMYKQRHPDVPVGIICDIGYGIDESVKVRWADFVGISKEDVLNESADKVKDSGKEIVVWTVENSEEAETLNNMGYTLYVADNLFQ